MAELVDTLLSNGSASTGGHGYADYCWVNDSCPPSTAANTSAAALESAG